MKPLLFLTYRQAVNGVMRALGNPRRLIGLLFLAGYWMWMFVFPSFAQRRGMPNLPDGTFQFSFPPLQSVDAFIFGVFMILNVILLFGLLSQNASFKPADVDVLFATPISPKVVLVFRIVRDYLLTLIVPFFFVLFGIRPVAQGWEAFFRSIPHPEYSGMAIRAVTVGWLLMAMTWVSLNYATSLFINRSDKASDRNRKLLAWGVSISITLIIVYIGLEVRNVKAPEDILQMLQSPVLRVFFFASTMATALVMGPFSGDVAQSFFGFAGLVAIIGIAIKVALTQSAWMYDQAAVRGFDGAATMKDLQRKGDVMGVAAEMARRGKLKARRETFVHRIKARGHWALLWKEVFLQTRGMLATIIMLAIVTVFMVLVPILLPSKDDNTPQGILFLTMQGFALMSVTLALAQIGFVEVLRRVDLLKPLPFSSTKIAFFEVASRSMMGTAFSWVGAILVTVIRPGLIDYTLAAFILAPCASMLMSAVVFLVTLIFPDVEDQSQRQFRGLVVMFALGVAGLPPVLVMVAGVALKGPLPIVSLAAGAVAFGLAVLCSFLSGRLYMNYNPSE